MRTFIFGCAALLLSACASTREAIPPEAPGFSRPTERTRIILMPPNVSMSVMTAGGLSEVRADWTGEAQDHLVNALNQMVFNRGHELALSNPNIPDADIQTQFVLLHGEVGASMEVFSTYTDSMINVVVPSKADNLDWTLGADAAKLAHQYDAGLALFISSDGNFPSGGRVAVAAVSAVVFGVLPDTGFSVTRLSLVDLQTGDVVWMASRAMGDPRTADGAQTIIDALTTDIPL